ncbi:MAG: D-alanyl-D-alanine carboxypeptidase [Verrucomicrobia bacterium]|nr:D-alanyl-D-alanine carboxypeptidase [Verrucomicrobiota bacterium]MBS0647136.1 D-alanyl-D-alanine carboxypeptidase [Verrucomicrobiota bacterium]
MIGRNVWWCLLWMLNFQFLYAQKLNVSLHAENAILINAKTGSVLFEKKADEPTYPASTTKIAPCLYVLEHYSQSLNAVVTVKKEALASITPQAKRDSNYRSPPHWLETDGTHIGLKAGEEMTLYHLLHAALISSANDACNSLALYCEKNVPTFMEKLNTYLKSIGCEQTNFNNPHGLHHPAHVTTARDLASMARRGLTIPLFREIVAHPRYTCPRSNLQEERTLLQTNLFLRNGAHFDPRVIGIKTGGTQAAGKNLVAAAKEGDRELIAVILGCKVRAEVYQDTKALFDAAFSQPLMRRVIMPEGPSSLSCKIKGARGKLQTMLIEAVNYDFYPAEEETVYATVTWQIPSLPIKKGTCVGTINVINDQGAVIKSGQLYAANDVKKSIILLSIVLCLILTFIIFLVFCRR